jgi:hypothetical protein
MGQATWNAARGLQSTSSPLSFCIKIVTAAPVTFPESLTLGEKPPAQGKLGNTGEPEIV